VSDKKAVLLTEWAEAYFSLPPSLWTLRRMAREGLIYPAPVKVGKSYYVTPDAVLAELSPRPTLVDRLRAA
jgi:hypothetical protein